jgi:type III pantothenate kinase
VILAIDCGNTRIKWGSSCLDARPGAAPAGHWEALGSLPLESLDGLEQAWAHLEPPARIVVSNVAGERARAAVEGALRRFPIRPVWTSARREQCGVRNSYADPAQLGPDRWAALIGARALHRGDCLVVNAGTATTADLLSADGEFRGGVILPGVRLMKRSLAEGTAGLPLAEGRYDPEPRTTADAIETGCLAAQAGAVKEMLLRLGPGAACLLSGGAAGDLAAVLGLPVRLVDNLTLEGLVRIALEEAGLPP